MNREYIGDIEVLEQIGAGGLGVVYRGYDAAMRRDVALKRIRTQTASDAVAALTVEAAMLRQLHHPNIAAYYDQFEHEGEEVLVTEFVEGASIHQIVSNSGALTWQEALELLLQMLDGLAYVHLQGVTHGDIKAGNLMVSADGTAKLLDFGLARTTFELRSDGRIRGTPAYMSPEQVRGEPAGVKSDIYSTGILLYQLVTGRLPFDGAQSDVLQQQLESEPPALHTYYRAVPKTIEAIIAKALAKRAEERYQSAAEMRGALHEAAQGESPPASGWHRVYLAAARRQLADPAKVSSSIISSIGSSMARLAAPPTGHVGFDYSGPRTLGAGPPSGILMDAMGAEPDDGYGSSEATGAEFDGDWLEEIVNTDSKIAEDDRPRGTIAASTPLSAFEPEDTQLPLPSFLSPAPQTSAASPPESHQDSSPSTQPIGIDFGTPKAETWQKRRYDDEPTAADAPAGTSDTLDIVFGRGKSALLNPLLGDVPLTRTTAEQERPPLDENVQFTVYRPGSIAPEKWYALLAFMHLSDEAEDGRDDVRDPIAEVKRQAKAVLGDDMARYQDLVADTAQGVPKSNEITFLPFVEGIVFNPERRVFTWNESVHREEFRMRAVDLAEGSVARGSLIVLMGPVVLAEVPLTIRIGVEKVTLPAVETAARYRKVFASYAREDLAIVMQVEEVARSLGDTYLRDLVHLRSGEDWRTGLREMIHEADLFQLFWSTSSMRSPQVREEYLHALALNRKDFVRPTYWESPIPKDPNQNLPPPELKRLHFHKIVFPDKAALYSTDRTGQTGEGTKPDEPAAAPMALPCAPPAADYAPNYSRKSASMPAISSSAVLIAVVLVAAAIIALVLHGIIRP